MLNNIGVNRSVTGGTAKVCKVKLKSQLCSCKLTPKVNKKKICIGFAT